MIVKSWVGAARGDRAGRSESEVLEGTGVEGRRAALDGDLEAVRRVSPEGRRRRGRDRTDVGEADVAGVRDDHRAVRRVTGDEVRDRDERRRGALVVARRERGRSERVARVVGRGGEARARLVRRDRETDQHEG